jgi:hypothetical protein
MDLGLKMQKTGETCLFAVGSAILGPTDAKVDTRRYRGMATGWLTPRRAARAPAINPSAMGWGVLADLETR